SRRHTRWPRDWSSDVCSSDLVAELSGLLGLLALALACIGLYGLLAYEVARRTREIGIRTALGAQRGDVLRLVVKQGLSLALVGEIGRASCRKRVDLGGGGGVV